jgi:hypothetical protein
MNKDGKRLLPVGPDDGDDDDLLKGRANAPLLFGQVVTA